jgi:hypothetical protein
MMPEIHPGFVVYKNRGFDHGLVFIAPHSGPSLFRPHSRDSNAETVASLCWEKLGGNLIVGNIPRRQEIGIDLNRRAPDLKSAMDAYDFFLNENGKKETIKYKKKYAWVAKDKKDHKNRQQMYDNFWLTVRNIGNFYVFFHRKMTRLKNYPSVFDIVSFSGKGIEHDIIKEIVNNTNKKHKDFLTSVHENYKEAVLLEQRRILSRIDDYLNTIDQEDFEFLNKDIDVIKKYADKKLVKRLENNFNVKNFLMAVKSVLNRTPEPRMTLESIFTGDLAHGPKNELRIGDKNIVLEIEINEFFSKFYPEKMAEIISNIIKEIRSIEKYRMLGFTQTQIKKFITKDMEVIF